MSAKCQAFPGLEIVEYGSGPREHQHTGLTKREYFATAALQGITANPNFFGSLFQQNPLAASDFAVECADAIIARLSMPQVAAIESATGDAK